MTSLLLVLAVLLAMAVVVVGTALPKGHVASRTARYRPPPQAVWQVIVDHAAEPSWRKDLRSVERAPDRDGHAVWRETDRHGQAMALETLEEVPPRRLVRRIVDTGLPFGGSWTIEVAPEGAGSVVTVTEEGEVKNPLFRLVSRFVMGHAATIDKYLKALGKRFGEDVSIS